MWAKTWEPLVPHPLHNAYEKILPERGRSAALQGRSASRSGAPDSRSERNPERRSGNRAGARLERRSGFCRSANTLLYLSTRSWCTANVCLCKTVALEKVYIGNREHFELLDDKSPYYTSMYWIGPHKVARGHVRNFFCLFVLQRFHFFYDVPTTVIYRVNVIFDEWWSTFCVLSEWGKLFLFVWQRFQT